MSTPTYDINVVPQDLKDWIDGDQHADLKSNSMAPFLYKSSWTELDLCHALIYARNQLRAAMYSLYQAMKLAEDSYSDRIDISLLDETWGSNVGLPEGTLAEWQWNGAVGERYVFATDWSGRKELRRTISALCKMRQAIQMDDAPLRRVILKHQDEGKGPNKPAKAE